MGIDLSSAGHGDDALLLLDCNGAVQWSSHGIAWGLGYGRALPSGRDHDFLHPADLPELLTTCSGVRPVPGQPRHVSFRVRHRSGDWIWVDGSAYPIVENGGCHGIAVQVGPSHARARIDAFRTGLSLPAAAFQDETAAAPPRAEMLDALLAAVLDISPDAVINIESNGTILHANRAAESLFGYLPDELAGQQLELLVPVASRELHRRLRHEFAASGRKDLRMEAREEVAGRRKDGSTFPAEISVARVETSGPPVFVAVVHDVSGAREAEAALRRHEEAFRTLLDGSPNLIALVDSTRRLSRANEAHRRLLDYDPDSLVEEPVADLVHTSDRAVFSGWLTRVASGMDTNPCVVRMLDSSSAIRWFEVHPTVLDSAPSKGSDFRLLLISLDITDRKEAERRLLHAQKMDAIGRLAGGIAHDFNNTLTAIINYATLAADELPSSSPAARDMTEVIEAASRASGLTRQLLAFARREVTEPENLDANTVLANLEPMLRRLVGNEAELLMSLQPGRGQVRIDPSQLEQLVVNLVVNARDAMPAGGTIEIGTGTCSLDDPYDARRRGVDPGSYVAVWVSDTGEGIDEATRERLFEPFFTTKDAERGTGLGLATCYGIARQNGGAIWVDSAVGSGTTFTFILPLAPSPPSDEPAHADEGAPTLAGARILVVDDDERIRRLTERVLSGSDCEVTVAANADEAVALLEDSEAQYDLLLTDVVMPRRRGTELARDLQARRPDLRVLFMSGYAFELHGRGCPDLAGAAFIQKPFSAVELTTRIAEVLAG